jgi:hypothetical protein
MRKKKPKKLPHRHAFRFKIPAGEGERSKVITSWADVIAATNVVVLTLTADDVRRSIRLKGVGNTQTCAMAVCAKRHADKFLDHDVEGYIDWQYSRCYVVSQLGKETNQPVECYGYMHNDTIARLNDTKGGQDKLLADLLLNGPREVTLYPLRQRGSSPGSRKPTGENDGTRTSKVGVRGAHLRFAVANQGGVETEK